MLSFFVLFFLLIFVFVLFMNPNWQKEHHFHSNRPEPEFIVCWLFCFFFLFCCFFVVIAMKRIPHTNINGTMCKLLAKIGGDLGDCHIQSPPDLPNCRIDPVDDLSARGYSYARNLQFAGQQRFAAPLHIPGHHHHQITNYCHRSPPVWKPHKMHKMTTIPGAGWPGLEYAVICIYFSYFHNRRQEAL